MLIEVDSSGRHGSCPIKPVQRKITNNIKSYALILKKPFGINRAISTAGGVTFNSIDKNFMLNNKKNIQLLIYILNIVS